MFDFHTDDLRRAVVATAVTLACFFSAWLSETLARLHTDTVVLALALSIAIARTQQGRDLRARLPGLLLIPVGAAVAGEIGVLMGSHDVIGDILFSLGVTAAIWARRFGRSVAQAGVQATLPLIAVLISPGPPNSGLSHVLWTAAVAAIDVILVGAGQLLSVRLGIVPPPIRERTPAPSASPDNRGRSTARRASTTALAVTDRLALQMGVGVGAAFWLGHQLFHEHWSWVVLTAYIVASGNRGRGDVMYKGGLRVLGAACGTLIATGLGDVLPLRSRWLVVAIFAILGPATWLRTYSYAFWAGSVTAVLALLFSYYGEHGGHLLETRLEAIALGAALGVATAWLVLPVRTTDQLWVRIGDALVAMAVYLRAARAGDAAKMATLQGRFDRTVTVLDRMAPTVSSHRRFTQRFRPALHPMDAVAALQTCQVPMHALTAAAERSPEVLREPAMAEELTALGATMVAIRKAMTPAEPQPGRRRTARLPPLPLGTIAELPEAFNRVLTHARPLITQGPHRSQLPSPAGRRRGRSL